MKVVDSELYVARYGIFVRRKWQVFILEYSSTASATENLGRT